MSHATFQQRNYLVAIVGGSGAGKTWLAQRLAALLPDQALSLSLDDFYRDRSHLSMKRRDRLNFDHPAAIDWPVLTQTLAQCHDGATALAIPRYDFATHSRLEGAAVRPVKPVIVVDGLWLFHRPVLRSFFDLKIFIECPAGLRLLRRIERDMLERGRMASSVAEQFKTTVLPMHDRYVQPQAKWADALLQSPLTDGDVTRLAIRVKTAAESKMSCPRISSGPLNN